MSRFYDTLKQASRAQDANDLEPREPWNRLSGAINDLRIDPQVGGGSELPSEAAVPITAVQPARNPSTGVRIVFDKTAPLIHQSADPAAVEHYRRLRTRLLQLQTENPFRSLMITSPAPRDGKTVTVLNIALSFAMLPEFRVLVVDGDIRRGGLSQWLGLDNHAGLSDFIEGSVMPNEVIMSCEGTCIDVMGRGTSRIPPAELLQSAELPQKIRQLTQNFSLVLIDSPPVNLITDAQLLAGSSDAVLLVARAFTTKRKAFEKAAHDLQSFRVVGTVLNGGTRAQPYRRYRGYY